MNSEDEKLASRIAEILARLIQEGSDIGSIPAATYRIQLNHRFTFKEAAAIIPYLSSLGVTHIYTSPYLMAKSESLHGYDISDHNALNPEIGSEEEYGVFIKKLRAEGLGQVIDIVPNHMGITESKNRWWMDVLENGPSSAYAHYFDIDWNPVKEELRGKVLLPILGDQYGKALERQELSLIFEESGFFALYDHRELPIAAQTYPLILRHRWEELERRLGREYEDLLELELLISALDRLPPLTESDMEKIAKGNREKEVAKKRLALLYAKSPPIRSFIDENIAIFNGRKGDPHSFDLLDRLLNVQAYRLANWRVAADEINYRRFFDINDLASISMERPEVFEETHRLIFRLIREGKVQGLRIDHPDGLYDPPEYLERLQRRCLIEKAKAFLPPAVLDREALDSMMMDILDRVEKEGQGKGRGSLPLYLIVEKILSRGERLPTAWPVHGTVGYEFAHVLNGLFIDATHAGAFDQIYSDFIGERLRFQDVVYERKKMVMNTTMASEINVLARRLNRLSEKDRLSRDFTLYSLRDAIREIIACFPVYRT
ncbi:MAG TPA: malto-oligosyltrehalose synthase, partial [Candidatus Manganitrophaceae bacterium]|nr:malto-oligosyltrehalose synthase [Candidatus Manganitrophaceae bacterium]